LFGSVARGEDHHGSDIDILVDLRDDSDVLAIYELRELLVPMLGDRVDVACPEVLRKKVLARAIEEAVAL
jgi:predicted nucleotidyltransferase